ncbi:sulfotransferase family protein [Blastococcus sp. SYSU D00695]
MHLPNAVIAGVNKAGTTSLFHALASHPDVACSTVKETHFFDPVKYGEPLPPLQDYARYFPDPRHRPVLLEATPGYFYGGEAMARVVGTSLPDARVVVVLREPGERAFSWWRFCRAGLTLDPDIPFPEYLRRCERLGTSPESSRDMVGWRGLSGGLYSHYLPHWRAHFDDRLLVLFHDDLRRDPDAVLARVCRHLGIPPLTSTPQRQDNVTTDVSNRALQRVALEVNRAGEQMWRTAPRLKSALRRAYYGINARRQQDRLEPADRAWLARYFQEDLAALRGMLDGDGERRLPSWLEEA